MTAIPTTVRARQVPGIFRAKVPAIWRYVTTQPASFWLVNLYMFFEYVRPQSIWPPLAILPWSLLTLAAATAAMLLEGKIPRLTSALGPLLMLFTGILVLSSFFAVEPAASYAGWPVFLNWILVYFLITTIVTSEKRFFIFMLAFLLYSFKMSQHGFLTWVRRGFAFAGWGVTGAPGWFHNSGEFGIQMCVFLPLIVEFILALRRHWGRWTRWAFYFIPVTAVAGVIASSSRGALLGVGAVCLWWVGRSTHRVRSLVTVAVLATAVWAVVPAEQKARFDSAGVDQTSTTRLDRWEAGIAIANAHPVLGIGYNNWYTYYGPLSHNIFIEAWAELGYSGLLAFLALIVGTFVVNRQTRKLMRGVPAPTTFITHMAYGLDGALIGYLASGFFVTVLYYPYFWINLAMTAALHTAAQHERRIARSAIAVHNSHYDGRLRATTAWRTAQ